MEVGGDKTNKTTLRFLQRWLPVFLVGLFDTYGRSDSLTDNVAFCGELRQLGITSLDQLDVLCVVLCRKIQRVTGCGCCIALLLPQISVHGMELASCNCKHSASEGNYHISKYRKLSLGTCPLGILNLQ